MEYRLLDRIAGTALQHPAKAEEAVVVLKAILDSKADSVLDKFVEMSGADPATSANNGSSSTVQLTAEGYNSQGFAPQTGGEPQSATWQALAAALPPNLSLQGNTPLAPISPTICAHITTSPSTGPVMPNLSFALVAGYLVGEVTWTLSISYNRGNGTTDTVSYDTLLTTPASVAFNPNFDLSPTIFQGGTATLTFSYASWPAYSANFCVDGQNPAKTDVQTYLSSGSTFWALPSIIDQESQYQQFKPQPYGPVLEASDFGFGLMQLTVPAPTASQIWNWQYNVTAGVALFNSKQAAAYSFWTNQISAYNTFVSSNPGNYPPPSPGPECTYCTFTYGPSGQSHSFGDAIWIKRYNGAPTGFDFEGWNVKPANPLQVPPPTANTWYKNTNAVILGVVYSDAPHNYVGAICMYAN